MKKAMYKVPNGKLLKILLEDDGGKILQIKITGDFFAHPEENIEKLEKALAGVIISAENLKILIENFLKETPTQLLGVDADSIVSTILQAKNQP